MAAQSDSPSVHKRFCFSLRTLVLFASVAAIFLTLDASLTFPIFLKYRSIRRFPSTSPLTEILGFASTRHDSESLPKSLSEYVYWHAKKRTCIIEDTCKEPLPPTFIWRCPSKRCAGVGDRVRGIQVSFLVALALGRLFFIEWPEEPYPFSDVIVPAVIDWRVPEKLQHDTWPHIDWFSCPGKDYVCRPHRRLPSDEYLPHVNKSFPSMNLYTDDIGARLANVPHLMISSRLPGDILPKIFRNPHLASPIPDLHTDFIDTSTLLRIFIRLLFKPSAAVESVINSTLPADFVEKGYVSVHARTGEDVGELGDKRFAFINRHRFDAAEELLACAEVADGLASKRIFLASDSMNFKDIFTKMAQDSNIELWSIQERAYHFGIRKSFKSYHNESSEDQKRKAFINVFADLFILGGGQAILTTGSGFGRTAFWLGRAPRLIEATPGNGTEQCVQ